MKSDWWCAPVWSVCLALGLGVGAIGWAPVAQAETVQFKFLAPSDTEEDTLWRVDTLSGEVGMCTFEKSRRSASGVMSCLKPGSGASIQKQPGPYKLVPSNREDAKGVFRVNQRTGTMSLCYDVDDRKGHRIVCTEPNR